MTQLDRALADFVRDNTPTDPPPPLGSTAPAAGRSWSRHPSLVAAAAVLLVVAVGVGWFVVRPGSPPGVRVVDTSAASTDRYPSTTPQDWVTYADHVVRVTVTDERAVAPEPGDTEGADLIGREVTARVDDVLWSRPDADRPAPTTLRWQTWGWLLDRHWLREDERVPMVGDGESRVEPGHEYVVALAWEDERCAEGDGREPAAWVPLGPEAVVAADSGLLGVGEVEGRDRSVAQARAADDTQDPNRTIGQNLAGEPVDRLVRELQRTRPGTPEVFGEPAPCP